MPQVQLPNKKRRGNASLTGRTTRIPLKPYWPGLEDDDDDEKEDETRIHQDTKNNDPVTGPLSTKEDSRDGKTHSVPAEQKIEETKTLKTTPPLAAAVDEPQDHHHATTTTITKIRSKRRRKSHNTNDKQKAAPVQVWKEILKDDNTQTKDATTTTSLPSDLQMDQSSKKRKLATKEGDEKETYADDIAANQTKSPLHQQKSARLTTPPPTVASTTTTTTTNTNTMSATQQQSFLVPSAATTAMTGPALAKNLWALLPKLETAQELLGRVQSFLRYTLAPTTHAISSSNNNNTNTDHPFDASSSSFGRTLQSSSIHNKQNNNEQQNHSNNNNVSSDHYKHGIDREIREQRRLQTLEDIGNQSQSTLEQLLVMGKTQLEKQAQYEETMSRLEKALLHFEASTAQQKEREQSGDNNQATTKAMSTSAAATASTKISETTKREQEESPIINSKTSSKVRRRRQKGEKANDGHKTQEQRESLSSKKELELYQTTLCELQAQNFQLNMDLTETQKRLSKSRQEAQEREQQHLTKLEELSTLAETQELRIGQRDDALQQVRQQHESMKSVFHDRMHEALTKIEERDYRIRVLELENAKLRERVLALGVDGNSSRLTTNNSRMKPTPKSNNGGKQKNPFTNQDVFPDTRETLSAEPSQPRGVRSLSSSFVGATKRRDKKQRLSRLIPAYDSLAEAASPSVSYGRDGKPTVTIDSP